MHACRCGGLWVCIVSVSVSHTDRVGSRYLLSANLIWHMATYRKIVLRQPFSLRRTCRHIWAFAWVRTRGKRATASVTLPNRSFDYAMTSHTYRHIRTNTHTHVQSHRGLLPGAWGSPKRGMPTGSKVFLALPDACGLRPCDWTHLKNGLVPYSCVGGTYDK